MNNLEVINTLSGKAVIVNDLVIVLSEIASIRKPGFIDTIAYDSIYGITIYLKGNKYCHTVCRVRLSDKSDTNVTKVLADMQPAYDFILKHWTI